MNTQMQFQHQRRKKRWRNLFFLNSNLLFMCKTCFSNCKYVVPVMTIDSRMLCFCYENNAILTILYMNNPRNP